MLIERSEYPSQHFGLSSEGTFILAEAKIKEASVESLTHKQRKEKYHQLSTKDDLTLFDTQVSINEMIIKDMRISQVMRRETGSQHSFV
ncbi:MAG: hypothetical protein R6T98_03010 [Desulfatiglandales bacterium]